MHTPFSKRVGPLVALWLLFSAALYWALRRGCSGAHGRPAEFDRVTCINGA